jgi:polyhydroxybutyrate depolymerase
MRGRPPRRIGHHGVALVTLALMPVAAVTTACSPSRVVGASPPGPAAVASSGCAHAVPAGAVAPGGERTETLVSGAVSGSYELSVPRAYRARRPSPLILLFYGFDSGPAQFSALTGLPARGATDGSLERTYCVDRSAVFAAGFSAGAAFTIVYSCARENQIAAIATVAVEFQLGCTRPLSILAFHGTKDPLVPYQNGAIGLSLPGIKVRGTELNMGDWARLDHCRAQGRRLPVGSQVVEQRWSGCSRGTSVVLYTVLGGGHSWPGADPTKAIGLTTEQVSATSQVLSFFGRLRH